MSAAAHDEAVVMLDATGRYVDANPAALEMLGVTMEELLASPSDRFSMEPAAGEDRAAFRSEWEADGAMPLIGTAGLRRADGTTIRVSYAIETVTSGLRARMSRIEGSPAEPGTVLSVGQVLREWRAAERELAELAPNTTDWSRLQDEIERLRTKYQEAFRSLNDPSRSTSPSEALG